MAALVKPSTVQYTTDGKGKHSWIVETQKPFLEFREEVNQAVENSWMNRVFTSVWSDRTTTFKTYGGDGWAKWGDGKVQVELRVHSLPATYFERQIVYEVRRMTLQACAYEFEEETKESLRQNALDTYRETCFNELEAGIMVGRWQKVDEVTKLLAALTSSGSAVAGWVIWGKPEWQRTWQILAGTAAMLSIMHVVLKVSDRVKDWSDTAGHFVRLRTDIETFLYHFRVNPGFALKEYTATFDALRTRFGEGVSGRKADPIAFGTRKRAKPEVDEKYEALAKRTRPITGQE